MTTFTQSVDHHCKDLTVDTGPCPGCDDCGLADVHDMDDELYDMASEAWFSRFQCDSCGSTFGGDRFYAHGTVRIPGPPALGWVHSDEVIHLNICVDCLFYHANGDEPETWTQNPN